MEKTQKDMKKGERKKNEDEGKKRHRQCEN